MQQLNLFNVQNIFLNVYLKNENHSILNFVKIEMNQFLKI